MKYLALMAIALSLLLFGCIQAPPGLTGAGSFDKSYSFTALTNNSTSETFELNTVLPVHAFSYNFTGTGWSTNGTNLSFQGSIDNSNFVELGSVLGSTNGASFIVDKPVMYVRVVASVWNATAGNATQAAVVVRYAGTG